jgi:hypothetical protein
MALPLHILPLMSKVFIPILAACFVHGSLALADEKNKDEDQTPPADRSSDQDDGALNDFDKSEAPRPEPNPTPPGVDGVDTGIHRQAGTGSSIAFAEAGVVEIGGAGSFDTSSAGTVVALRPSIGWFFIDNFAVSAILEMRYAKPDMAESVTAFGLFGEPSFHLPVSKRTLPFLGVGFGVAYNEEDVGFAMRPRLGVDLLIGRSGVLRPALDFTWSTTDIVTRGGETLVGVKSALGVSFGYHVML